MAGGTSINEVDDSILSLRDVSVTFGMERGKSKVLNSVSLDIERQEILGVVGESGSGKSMFASALLDAVVKPGVVSGDITYRPGEGSETDLLNLSDEELRQLRWEEISMVFQGAMSSFNPTKDIRGHFEETLKDHDYDVESGMAHARELLSDLYLEPERVLNSYPHELSGGMSQRTLIALSLVLEPEVLVMDEPTAALDLLMQRSILALLEDLQTKYDLTIVFITHDLPLVAGLADRLAVMYAFEFVEIGPADELVQHSAHPYTRSLLRAVPNLDSPLDQMHPIEGASPDPVNVPTGCSYHPRCSLATDECRSTDPPLEEVEVDHRTACFHWQESRQEIPLIDDEETGEHDSDTPIRTAAPTDTVVEMQDVDVHFEQSSGFFGFLGESDIVHAVDDVNLDIHENDVVALVGESGCGKTTLGKAAIGIQRPTSGEVSYRGQDIWEAKDSPDSTDIPFDEIRQSLQIIHQDPGSSLNPNRTIESTLEMALKYGPHDMKKTSRRNRIHGMLSYVGMNPSEDYASRYPHQLSGGEKQRVALVRALMMNPDLILADESVSALDVSLRIEMMDLMLELQEQFDTSYVFISHNLSNARYFAGLADGKIGVMYLGELVEIGPAQAVIENPKHPYTEVLKWSTEDLNVEEELENPPIRGIDIPDPVDPPSGCRFHTRCPYAREACVTQSPSISEDENEHGAACFRDRGEDHEYWDSDPIQGVEASDD
ncbi:dipeptide ABC transporter ATP-binding protein [Halomontanus rarus]|uniref:dipeptide ABC transporter ATP-binding protein n=1 Tax=Halomontanus rarus TaxID=3034020 RepID=UPI001A991E96